MNNTRAARTVLAWLLLVLILLTTRPESLPLPMLIVPFVLLWVAVYSTVTAVLNRFPFRRSTTQIIKTKPLAAVTASTIVVCTGLESIGEFTLKDCASVVLFAVVAYFYLTRNLQKTPF